MMKELADLIVNNGVAVVVVAFFMYRDIKFMSTLQTTLTTLVDTVDGLKDIVKTSEDK